MNYGKSKLKIIFLAIIFLGIFGLAKSSKAATYYVDASGGLDTNNGIAIATPWRTIAKVNGTLFQPGDNILFKRGEIWREQLTVSYSGTPGNPITFGAYGSGEKPLIDRGNKGYWGIQIVGKNYITLINMAMNTSGGILVKGGSIYIKINNLELTDCAWGILAYDGGYHTFSNNIISNPTYAGIALYGANPAITTPIHDIEIDNNIISGGSDCITLHRSDDGFNYEIGSNFNLYHNTVFGASEDGFDLTSGTNIIVLHNESYNNLDSGAVVWWGASGVILEYNYFHNNNKNIHLGTNNNLVAYNILTDSEFTSLRIGSGTGNKLYNNAITNNTLELNASTLRVLSTDTEIRNNVVYNANPSGYVYALSNNPGLNNIISSNNCWYRAGGDSTGGFNIAFLNYSFSSFQTFANVYDKHFVDPLFISSNDFHLQSTSPAIDAGTDVGLTTDFDGHLIVGAPDIGMYEFQPGNDIISPVAPDGLTVN